MKKALAFCLILAAIVSLGVVGCYERLESCRHTGSCAPAGGELGGQGGDGGAGIALAGRGGSGVDASPCATPCVEETPLCHEETGQCVQCLTSDDCGDQVCDPESLRCVDCTPETEEERCGTFSCSRLTQSCTTTPRGLRGTCDPCEADSECSTGRRCVLHTFQDEDVGYFCFLDHEEGGCGDTVPMRRPYRRVVPLSSIDGIDSTYCLPPSGTTCQGLRDTQSKNCTESDECGVAGLDDGYCPTSGTGAGLCSYLCAGTVDCLSLLECSDTPAHCRPMP